MGNREKGGMTERMTDFLYKKIGMERSPFRRGAAGRSRTGTELPPTDFESVASANFTTAAYSFFIKRKIVYHSIQKIASLFSHFFVFRAAHAANLMRRIFLPCGRNAETA